MRVNLLEKDASIKVEWVEILVVLLIILIFTLPIVHFYLNYIEVQNLKQRRSNWETRLKAMEPELAHYQNLKKEIDNFKLPAKVELEKYNVYPFFLEFAKIIEGEISFNNLDYNSGQINIQGRADDINSLLDFSARIFDSEVFSLISLERFEKNNKLEFNLVVKLDNRQKDVIYNE
ncbi:MAG: PilN domain-containing protein [Bacillota bacterium]